MVGNRLMMTDLIKLFYLKYGYYYSLPSGYGKALHLFWECYKVEKHVPYAYMNPNIYFKIYGGFLHFH